MWQFVEYLFSIYDPCEVAGGQWAVVSGPW